MIIRIVLLLYSFCCCLTWIQAQGGNRLDFLLRTLNDGGKSDYVMIFAHRGDWRNAPENSLQAYQNCIDASIDGIEIDVRMTKDSAIVIMHDQTVNRTTTGNGRVQDYTLSQLKKLQLVNAIGVATRHTVPTLEEVLLLTKGKILIQVDKWQPIKEEVIRIASKYNMLNQLVLRGVYSSEIYEANYKDIIEGVNYIPVLVCKGNQKDDVRLDDFISNIQTSVISLSFKNDNYPIMERVTEIKQKGFRVWYNSMWAEFNGGHDDEMAENDRDGSYGWLLKKGANIIFSDRPFLVDSYLKKIGRRCNHRTN